MKLTNIHVVASIHVPACSGWRKFFQYGQARKEKASKEISVHIWANLDHPAILHPGIVGQIAQTGTHHAFDACIIAYDFPRKAEVGMDRRSALSVIRKAQLEAPSTVETIMLATQTIVSGEVVKACHASSGRRVMAATPFHPEVPDFFYFGLGFEGGGSFSHHFYNYDGRGRFERTLGDKLYFWHRSQEVPLLEYNFPLLLGIRRH